MYVIWTANILIILAVAFLIWGKQPSLFRKIYWTAFGIKVAAGVALGLVYKYYYTAGDTFPYYYDAVKLADVARKEPFEYISFLWTTDTESTIWSSLNIQQPRAVFLSKAASFFSLVCRDNYWIIASYFSLLSFLASWYLTIEITSFRKSAFIPAAFAFLFFPSVAFWSSGLIKESLAMAALYVIVILFLRLWRSVHVSGSSWVVLILSFWVLWNLKYYYLAVLLPVAATAIVYHILERTYQWNFSRPIKVLVWLFLFSIPLAVASLVHPNFYPQRFLNVIVENYKAFVAISETDDLILYSSLRPEPFSILINAPKAFFSGIFRPFLWEVSNPMQLIASLENTCLLILTITVIPSLWKGKSKEHSGIGWIILLYCFLLCVFLALSTPNLGTLSRYRVGFLPFLVVLLCHESFLFRRFSSFMQRKFEMLLHTE